jgi:hypothetical protein
VKNAPIRAQPPPGTWYYENGALKCAGAVEVERLVVKDRDLLAEIADLKARLAALERAHGK